MIAPKILPMLIATFVPVSRDFGINEEDVGVAARLVGFEGKIVGDGNIDDGESKGGDKEEADNIVDNEASSVVVKMEEAAVDDDDVDDAVVARLEPSLSKLIAESPHVCR